MAKQGYEVTMDKSRLKIRFAFVSKGTQDVYTRYVNTNYDELVKE